MVRILGALTLTLTLALTGCTSASSPAPSGSPMPAVASVAELEQLLTRLKSRHPDPWHGIDEATFTSALREVQRQLPGWRRDRQLVEIMRLMTLLSSKGREAHQGVFPWYPEMDGYGAHAYPVRLWQFPDGLYVVAAQEPYAGLIGGKVTELAGHPITQISAAVKPLVSYDSEQTIALFAPILHIIPEVLHGLGLVDSVGPADIVVHKLDGSTATASLNPITIPAYREWSGPGGPVRLPANGSGAPAWLLDQATNLAVSWQPGSSTILVRFNLVRGGTREAATQLQQLRAEHPKARVIVDMRHNLGGDNNTYRPLLEALQDPAFELRVLIGRATFSAATNFVTELSTRPGVVFLGEATGGSPNLYADTTKVELKSLSIIVGVSTRYWMKSFAGDPRLALEPTVPVPLRAEDYFAGRDPVLAAALR